MYRSKSGSIGRVAHHTHDRLGMIAGTGCLGIERQREVADVVHTQVYRRQHSILVVCISVGGSMIPVHSYSTAVCIGAVGVNIRIVIVCAGSIIDTCPAVGERIGIGGC